VLDEISTDSTAATVPARSDIAQRFVAAISSSTPPAPLDGVTFDPNKHEYLGVELPTHLKHAHNLLGDLGNELKELMSATELKCAEIKAARNLFFTAVQAHVPNFNDLSGLHIGSDGQIYGTRGDSEMPADLREIMHKIRDRRGPDTYGPDDD
jgi:hypothetical protein